MCVFIKVESRTLCTIKKTIQTKVYNIIRIFGWCVQNARNKMQAGAKYQKGRRERGERGGLRFFCLPWAGFGKPVLSWLIEERKKEKERSRKRRL